MSFQNQGFCMAKGSDSINDGEVNYDPSRIELKRSHQWFMDGSEAELFFSKKQAVGVPTNNLFSGMLNSNISPGGNASNFQSISGHFSERLFDSDTARMANFDDRNVPLVCSEKARKVDDDPFGNDSSFNLSMSHTLEDPRSSLSYGGIRKIKVSQVKESENIMHLSMEHDYNRVDSNNTMSTSHPYEKGENTISMGLAYNNGDGHIMSVGETYDRKSNIFISMGQPYSKGDDSRSMSQTYKENNTTIAMGQTFTKGDNSIISVGQTCKLDESPISIGHLFSKGNDSTVLMESYDKGDDNNLSIGQSFDKGESTIISFGGYDEDNTNPSGQLISNYDLLMAQSSLQISEVINEKGVVNSNVDALASAVHTTASGAENVSKKKEDLKTSKNAPPNNFPSNVRSLLSTGMLDGVPVKYIAWSREELRGVIKGSGYLCGCQACNFSKVINAYEFERHANCKTKHPNNHIYFENGKTIYGIVQELRSTPQSMLFEVIQTITGSPINQKSFRLWKESFLAATRELQRIYGKDEGKPL
ncbi:uncharacterized protein LOC110666770 isoform X2 [Hevea brasiliensis]|uniref:uncharacterized protein LOC110666770 isoform X2 n=1 Tax=Hevea brasiliensis TaxID=3981 RepID=UPI0025F94E53|nr:uncharacterized protein LOC110666770 isoform X2 [Hevea brasiliensis]